MSSGPDSPADRSGLPPAPRRLASHVSRVGQASVPGGATSTWLVARSRSGRVLRHLAMPLAWAVTLLVCAGSAFAVRDVVFPSLGESAARSLWEPRPAAGVRTAPSPIRTTVSAERPPSRPSVSSTSSTEPAETTAPASSDATSRPEQRASGSGTGVPVPTVSSTPTVTTAPTSGGATGTTSPGDDDEDDATNGTTSSTVTTSTEPEDTSTTDGDTGDTIADDSGRRGSGSGGGGSSDDDLP